MSINHIDQLTQWWENAEVPTRATLPKGGDRIIIRYNPEWYEIATAIGDAGEDELSDDTRVLYRAPEPKPAWHDAVAVIAHADDVHIRQAWERDGDTDYWCGTEGHFVRTEKLRDVTPLIEAKVTDEARERVWRSIQKYTGEDDRRRPDYGAEIDGYITAALGLETA